jgi:hypothetical protein
MTTFCTAFYESYLSTLRPLPLLPPGRAATTVVAAAAAGAVTEAAMAPDTAATMAGGAAVAAAAGTERSSHLANGIGVTHVPSFFIFLSRDFCPYIHTVIGIYCNESVA